MELIVINQNKLKIMLTQPDMQRYELTPGALDCADEQTRKTFRRIFDDARSQIGFDTSGERLFVQLYTSREGGCEIFVTKLGEKADEAEEALSLSLSEKALLKRVFAGDSGSCRTKVPQAVLPQPPAGADAPSLPSPARRTSTRPSAILFPDLDSLTAACRRLVHIQYREESQVYLLDEEAGGQNRYCLLLRVPDTSFFRLPKAYGFLTEYGTESDAGLLSCYLGEYGQPICLENAVECLGQLA